MHLIKPYKHYFTTKIKRFILLFLSFCLQILVIKAIKTNSVNLLSLLEWLFGIFFLYLSFPAFKNVKKTKFNIDKISTIFLVIIIIIGVTIRASLMLNTNIFHIDEYLTAFFSYSLPSLNNINWFGAYPLNNMWIVQFPVFFFLFQKIFFTIFGISTLSMRFSILPYIIFDFILLFLIAKELFGKNTSLIAALIFAFLSPDLYLTRWGLHFISSTFVFLAATYFFILTSKVQSKIVFTLFGFFLGACYLTYYSSYIAFPVFSIVILFLFIYKKIDISYLYKLSYSLLIFAYMLIPFLIYAFTINNFFLQRSNQIGLLNGAWSPYKTNDPNLFYLFDVLMKQIDLSIKSFYLNGVGGVGGYWFGHLALFDNLTLSFFLLGVLYFIYLTFVKKGVIQLIFILTILFSFFSIVLSIPPPGFHRFFISFPFAAIIIAVTINRLYEFFKSSSVKLANIIVVFFIISLLAGNIYHFKQVLSHDAPDDAAFPPIEKDLTNLGIKKIYIAAFDSYSLGKVLFIRSNQKIQNTTMPLDYILKILPRSSYLILLYPDGESLRQIANIFPKSKVIKIYERHTLIKII